MEAFMNKTLSCSRCGRKENNHINRFRKESFWNVHNHFVLCFDCRSVTALVFPVLKNFNFGEFGDYTQALDVLMLTGLQTIRTVVGKPFIIHEAFATKGHSPNSYHYKGQAVDGHFKGAVKEKDLMEVYSKIDWWPGGIGIYPYWNTPGFHIDIGEKRRWWRNEDGEDQGRSMRINGIIWI
jgi:hypothetical protein